MYPSPKLTMFKKILAKKFTQTFSVQANKSGIEKVFHISKSALESSDVKAFLKLGVLKDKSASVMLGDVCDWLAPSGPRQAPSS